MKTFGGSWGDAIAEITGAKEFQTVTIRIEDPNLGKTEYVRESASWEIEGDPVIYEGQARIIQISRGLQAKNESMANPSTSIVTRVQIPSHELPIHVKRGFGLFVVSAPNNPSLESKVFRVTSDMQGGTTATRTFEVAADGDAVRS